MSNESLPGNPHVFPGSQIADPDTINEGFIGEEGITAETMLLSELTRNTEATLALAYEQRTANLIAMAALSIECLNAKRGIDDESAAILNARLGLGGEQA